MISSVKADGTIVVTDGDITTQDPVEIQPPVAPPTVESQQPSQNSPAMQAIIKSRIAAMHPPKTAAYWQTTSDFKAGNCHILPGARIDLSLAAGGISLHFQGQMKTDASIMGDTFHTTFAFYDKNDPLHVVLISPEVDLPQNAAMHPQFGNNSVDWQTTISPLPDPIGTLNSLGELEIQGAC
jgi:hypothetical protein